MGKINNIKHRSLLNCICRHAASVQPMSVGSGFCDKHEKNQIISTLFLLFPGVVFFNKHGIRSIFTNRFIRGRKRLIMNADFLFRSIHELTEADSIIDLQFQLENEPDIFGGSLQSSPFNPETLELQINRGRFRFYDPFRILLLLRAMLEYFKINFLLLMIFV